MSEHRPKLSIITAVHNQLPMNQIYWENLRKNTKNSFELIVIDNASTDASADFFESVGVRVIRNLGVAESRYFGRHG
jgi:glycosyltransferase involved in cell wall biosynthesis